MKKQSTLQTIFSIGLAAAVPAAMAWYCDTYVNWQPGVYPFAVVAALLAAMALSLLVLWARGERKKALVWKTLLSTLVFATALIAGSAIVNNWIGPTYYGRHMAETAAAIAVPLAAAQLLVLFALLLRAMWKQNRKGVWALAASTAVFALGFAAYGAADYARSFVPEQPVITPVFPEPLAERALIPYDEGEFLMQAGDILIASEEELLDFLYTRTGDAQTTVWLKGGSYAQPLELDGLKNVTFRNVPGEEVVFTGAKEVSGWQADEANGVACWSAQMEGDYFTSLYHPDPEKQLNRPRYPAEGYLFVGGVEGAQMLAHDTQPQYHSSFRSFFAKPGDLRQFHALEDVTLRVLHFWKDEITGLVSYGDSTRELVWERPSAMTVNRNDRYFLENVFEELKEPGQWYLDRDSGKLSYIPFEGEDMENTVLYAGINERLLTIDGAENVTFRGIAFKNSAWNMPDGIDYGWGMPADAGWDYANRDSSQAAYNVRPCVLVTNSTGVRFDRCKFENIGATALKFAENVHGSAVTGCEFTRIGGNAVFIEGKYDTPNSNITVKNNLIAHYGRRFFNAIGVLNIHAHHVEISHNEIFDGYYSAISSGWVWGYAENPTDYVSIEYNLIYQIGQGWLSDMGGIYTLGMQPNSVIRGNHIYDVAADPLQGGYGGWGIYPDEGSTGQLIEKNLAYRCGSQSFHQHYGKENLVRNNIFAFSGEGQIRVSRKEEHTSAIFERNIIVSDSQPIYTSVQQGKFRDDGNLLYDYANPRRPLSGENGKLALPEMRRLGYYQNALFVDPLFRDPEGNDFTLALNSPAVTELGFEIWDYSLAGRIREQE